MSDLRKLVYVAGPMTKGPMAANISQAMRAAVELVNAGFAPIVPHLWFYVEVHYPLDWAAMMEVDRPAVLACAAVLRLPGESRGADMEVGWADAACIPVYDNIEELIEGLG